MSHRTAIEESITAAGTTLTGRHAALLALCRTLADQMDQAGDEGPSTRLSAAYLSALKDFNRATATAPGVAPANKLSRLRAIEGGRGA